MDFPYSQISRNKSPWAGPPPQQYVFFFFFFLSQRRRSLRIAERNPDHVRAASLHPVDCAGIRKLLQQHRVAAFEEQPADDVDALPGTRGDQDVVAGAFDRAVALQLLRNEVAQSLVALRPCARPYIVELLPSRRITEAAASASASTGICTGSLWPPTKLNRGYPEKRGAGAGRSRASRLLLRRPWRSFLVFPPSAPTRRARANPFPAGLYRPVHAPRPCGPRRGCRATPIRR